VLKNSRDIKRRLEKEGFILKSVAGSHHKYWHPEQMKVVILPHPKKDIAIGTLRDIYKSAGWHIR
jgi:predicted RNA binding protein YcfA (HicA-like mRNA interferase family)